MAMKFRNKVYNPGLQINAMKSLYPQFKSKRAGNEIVFTGTLQSKQELPLYTVTITYRFDYRPIVKIISPEIQDNAPHIYPDKSLCLYHPNVFKWRKDRLIAKVIVPWASAWIYFYEVWKETGTWYGPEAPHNHNLIK